MSLPSNRRAIVAEMRRRIEQTRARRHHLDYEPISFGDPARKCPELHRHKTSGENVAVHAHVAHADGVGVMIEVTCPFCGEIHQHVVDAAWSGERLIASCRMGSYRATR